MIEETFTHEHLSVTLRVVGMKNEDPFDGETYKVVYFEKGENVAETEWLDSFDSKDIYVQLESLAEDWLEAEQQRENRLFNNAD